MQVRPYYLAIHRSKLNFYCNLILGDVYDVVIKTSKKPRSYWIRVQGLGAADCTAAFQQAVLKYEGTENVTPATLNTVALFDAMKFPVGIELGEKFFILGLKMILDVFRN